MREPGYSRINPRHETPVLITDEGRPLTETMAIAAYLEARDAERRISFDPRSPQADRMHQLMGFMNSSLTAAFAPLWTALEHPTPEPTYTEPLRRYGRESVVHRYQQLEAMVGDTPYLVGDRPSLADALFAGLARWLDFHEVASISRWSKLHALRLRLESEPAIQFAIARENGETPPGSLTVQLSLEELLSRYDLS